MTPKALSREIKFRVWNPKYKSWCGKEKGDWWLGVEYNTGKLVCIVDGKIEDAPDYLVTQIFTGLLDKNGKEIFEGDLIIGPMYARNSFVMFDERYATFKAQSGTQLVPLGYECKIIGNIYESPDLLTKENK